MRRTAMVRNLVSALAGLAFLAVAGAANAVSINWTATGLVGPLTATGGGTDVELLATATITLVAFVSP